MNPLLAAQVERLRRNVQRMGEERQRLERQLAEAQATAESRLKLVWKYEQARATSQSNLLEFGALQEELTREQELRAQLEAHAARIAGWSAALADSLAHERHT
jgi:predicted RNase H-like nuclease (RuvC/YqgF family)